MNSSEVAAAKFAGVRLASPGQHRATTTVVSSPNTVIGVYTIEVCVGKSYQFQFAYHSVNQSALFVYAVTNFVAHLHRESKTCSSINTCIGDDTKAADCRSPIGP